MSIFKQFQDIISTNLDELIEGKENPARTLRQAACEIRRAVVDLQREVAMAMAEEIIARQRLESNRRNMNDWDARAEKAAVVKDNGLARLALSRKRQFAQVSAEVEDQLRTAKEASKLLNDKLEAMQSRLNEAEHRLESLTVRVD